MRRGIKNGLLLQATERAGYDVLITVDQGIPYQTAAGRGRIAVIVLRAQTNQLEDLKRLVPSLLEALATIEPGRILTIDA